MLTFGTAAVIGAVTLYVAEQLQSRQARLHGRETRIANNMAWKEA